MDDFLYNLRKSVEERNKSGNTQRGDRRCGMDRRNRKPQKQHTDRRSYPPYNRNLHEIRVLLERFVEGQAQQQAIDDKRLELEKRRTRAMEQIADNLSRIAGSAVEAVAVPAVSAVKSEAPRRKKKGASKGARPTTPGELMTRLRTEGVSYEKIAQALEAEGFPTVSGRGRWRGQTVKRELFKLGIKK